MSLFTPTLFLFLALLLLVSGLLLFYMDMKLREQNHKIKAIADLATTIAQSLKGGNVKNIVSTENTDNMKEHLELIEVSDDSSEEDDDEEDDEDDEDDEDEEDDNDEDEDENKREKEEREEREKREERIETFTNSKHVLLLSKDESLVGLVEQLPNSLPPSPPSPLPPLPPSDESLAESNELDTFKIVLSSELDYKKMNITKLRQIVTEKGFATSSDANKMKKPELIKLLEAE